MGTQAAAAYFKQLVGNLITGTLHSPKERLQSSLKVLDCWMIPKYPEETHTCSGRTQKCHTAFSFHFLLFKAENRIFIYTKSSLLQPQQSIKKCGYFVIQYWADCTLTELMKTLVNAAAKIWFLSSADGKVFAQQAPIEQGCLIPVLMA